MVRIFERQFNKLHQLIEIARFCGKITPLFSTRYVHAFLRAIRLCRKDRFLPAEGFRLGLFNPNLPNSELSKYISRKKLTKVQEALNPVSFAPLLKDKGIFYRYCMVLGVPIPKLYAIFFREIAGWSFDGSVLEGRDDWEKFFAIQLPAQFVTKPTNAAYGKGLNIFARDGNNEFIDACGQSYRPDQLYDTLISNIEYDSFIIQERMSNHDELMRLSGTQSLQTVRFITFIDRKNNCRILHAHLKPIIGPHLVDTHIDGLTGNVEAAISLNEGILKPANQITGSGAGAKTIYIHPKTGVAFEGFKLPFWNQTCSVVKETALKFLPLRTIGWDAALTPDGPFIIEGNIWWDSPNQHRCMDIILDALS